MVGQTSVLPAVSVEGVPHSVTRLGVGTLLCQVCSPLKNLPRPWRPPQLSSFFFPSPRSPPPRVFKALKPEDFYPSSSLCIHLPWPCPPGCLRAAKPTTATTNMPPDPPSALTVPQTSPAASPNSTLPAALTMTPALTGQTRVQLWIGTKAHGAAGQDTTVCPTHSFRWLWHNKNPSSSSLHLPCPPGSPEARARLSGGCSCPVSSTG